MTCRLFWEIVAGQRDLPQLTRAERTALYRHMCECASCFKAARDAWLGGTHEERLEGVAIGRADLMARDPEAMPW